MKIKPSMQSAVNKHINVTLNAYYSFLAISAWFETTPFKGFAKWMLRQSDRDHTNAMKLFRYVKDRIGVVELFPIKQPQKSYESPLDGFQKAMEQIQTVVKAIHELYEYAVKENDYETQEVLFGVSGEYIIEEKNMRDMIEKLQVAGNDPDALLHMDYVQEKEA